MFPAFLSFTDARHAAGLSTLSKETPMGQSRDSVVDIWDERTPHHGAWPERVDQRTTDEPQRRVRSACVLLALLGEPIRRVRLGQTLAPFNARPRRSNDVV